MKRLITAMLTAALLISLTCSSLAGFDGFASSGQFSSELFSDVGTSDWFYEYVGEAYNRGLLLGKGGGAFDPGGTLTFGEAVTLAARLRSVFYGDNTEFTASVPFYVVYADYALENEIITEHGDYKAYATRAQLAQLLWNALPESVFDELNSIPDDGICDVTVSSGSSDAVYALYRAGIAVGSDRHGTFNPDSPITRAETCAILTRIVDSAYRLKITLPKTIPAEVIYERSADAVFMIETFDKDGNLVRHGSGFFISGGGYAITCAHVVSLANAAIVTLNDGRKYPVSGLVAFDAIANIAVLQIEIEDESVSFLPIADSTDLGVGTTVYALGSPLELLNTISAGVVSYANRMVGSQMFFQFTAAISFGSGGGPVLNSLGQVVGIASSSFNDGQRLNLAIPISLLQELEYTVCTALPGFNW